MRVWLLTVGEPLPSDSAGARPWRTGLLAETLTSLGHEVVWWTSAFDHFERRLRTPVDCDVPLGPGLTAVQLSGVAYERNVSIARLRNHRQVASKFQELARSRPKPDVVLSSLPTLELCDAASDYGRRHQVPVALDVRDLWPDVIFDLLPQPLKAIAPYGAPWMRRQLKRSVDRATAILGVTDEFVGWALDSAGRARSEWDRAFPMGYSSRTPSEDERRRADQFWDAQPLRAEHAVVCFFGTLGWMFDFDTVLAAAAMVARSTPKVRFVLCGGGEQLESLRARAGANVLLPGRVGFPEIWTLMRRSIAGLAPYRPFRNFADNVANKPIEYLSAGLPIITPDLRVLARLVRTERCGLVYPSASAEGLAHCVDSVASDDGSRAQMSAQATALFERTYVAERVYGDMANHLKQLAVSFRQGAA